MQKVSQYLPTENEIITFFDSHSGSHTVLRITELLIHGKVNHTTPHEEEYNHVRSILHSLKSKGFLVAENEGKNVIEESFYSTPDRLEKYHYPEVDKATGDVRNTTISGVINNGVMTIGDYNKTENIQNEGTPSSLKQIIIAVVAGVIVAFIIGINV
jgi:hypothetical protein